MMVRRKLNGVTALMLIVGVVVSCGGDDDAATESDGSPTTAAVTSTPEPTEGADSPTTAPTEPPTVAPTAEPEPTATPEPELDSFGRPVRADSPTVAQAEAIRSACVSILTIPDPEEALAEIPQVIAGDTGDTQLEASAAAAVAARDAGDREGLQVQVLRMYGIDCQARFNCSPPGAGGGSAECPTAEEIVANA